MNKKIAVLSTTIMLGLGNVIAIPTVKANTYTIQGNRTEISQANQAQTSITDQVNRVNQAIKENNREMQDVENQIAKTNTEVNQLNNQIKIINDRIEKRNNILKDRAIAMQQTGGDVSYLDVLLGASSIQDFIERIGSISTLIQADNNLLQQHEADRKAVEEKQAVVQSNLSKLTAMKTDLVGMREQLAEQKSQNSTQLAALMFQNREQAAAAINQGISETHQSGTSFSIPALTIANGSGTIDKVIQAGYRYIGNSVYVFGGGRTEYDVEHGYFDCSGFVHWAFSQAGISVGSSTDALLGDGRRVSASSMQPGDLVFFNTYKTNGHVGIYIGGGKFIGSQSSTGVAVANMSNSYWAQHFSGVVVRVIN